MMVKRRKIFNLKKIKITSILGIFFTFLIFISSGFCIFFSLHKVYKKKIDGSEFFSSLNYRIKVSLKNKNDPIVEYDDAQKIINNTASSLSSFLKDSGQDNYNVSSELYKNEDDNFYGYLSIKLNSEKIKSNLLIDKNLEVDNDPYLTFFNNVSNQNKFFVYKWCSLEGKTKYSVIPFHEFVDFKSQATKSIKNANSSAGVLFKVNDNNEINKIYENWTEISNNAKENQFNQPKVFIISNLSGLYSEANYHLLNAKNNQNTKKYMQVNCNTSQEIFVKLWSQLNGGKYCLTNNITNSSTPIESNFFDVLDNLDDKLKNLSWINKYIDRVYKSSEIYQIFPPMIANTYTNHIDDKIDISYMWLPFDHELISDIYLKNMKNYQWCDNEGNYCEIENYCFNDNDDLSTFKKIISYKKCKPLFIQTIFNGNYKTIYLSLGLICFLVIALFLLILLFKILGFFSWMCILLGLSLTLLIVSINTITISIALIFGLFMLTLAGLFITIAIGYKFKKNLNGGLNHNIAFKEAFKKGLWPSIDTFFITLIFGISFVYFSQKILLTLGTILIIGSFLQFAFTYILNLLLNFLLFENSLLINKWWIFGKAKNSNNNLFKNKCDKFFPFYQFENILKSEPKHIGNIIFYSCIGVIITSLLIFSIVGLIKTNLFFTNKYELSIIIDKSINKKNLFEWIKNSGLNYEKMIVQGKKYCFYRNEPFLGDAIDKLILKSNNLLQYEKNLFNKNVFDITNFNSIKYTFIALTYSCLFIVLYNTIKNNWVSFFPSLFACISSLSFFNFFIFLSFIALQNNDNYFKFNQTFTLSLILNAYLANIVSTYLFSSIKSSWIAKNNYSINEFKDIVLKVYHENHKYLYLSIFIISSFILCFNLFCPKGLWILAILFSLGVIANFIFLPYIACQLYYWFLLLRNIFIGYKNEAKESDKRKNYDEIDEQPINGINSFCFN